MKNQPQQGMIDLHDLANIQARRPLLVAHRGGVIAANAPENSLAAIRLAGTHGYDMVELDVREAKDREPVLFHGTWRKGLLVDCGVEQGVEDLTSEELTAIRYRASTEHIATLAQALALCHSLDLGLMLDIKGRAPSEGFLQRIADLVDEYDLHSATVTISHRPLVREVLADRVIFPVSEQDFERIDRGEAISLDGQYWFGWASALPDPAVELLHRRGAFVIPALNTFHYPTHARRALARQDARRLVEAGVDGFQIDSAFEDLFL